MLEYINRCLCRKRHRTIYSIIAATFVAIFVFISNVCAQQTNYLQDRNGDGVISYMGFGDSITYGVGDGTVPGQQVEEIPFTRGGFGYLKRVRDLAKISTQNEGTPGEVFTAEGIARFASVLEGSNADIVGILGGSNDANFRIADGTYERKLQRAINVAKILNRQVVLITPPPPCCDHESLAPITDSYGQQVKKLALVNSLPVADLVLAWNTTCRNIFLCDLYNLPEGLHPNIKGYDVIGQTILSAIYGIDIFSPDGAKEFGSAFDIPESEVVVKPVKTPTTSNSR
jgi:lysophospholipase L1-like esterase